ncbi:DUF1592 domain-containing protein [Opitutaceae bacterium]|nr:DUF1592 domain-containing protein [bacterium]MDB4384968.1 DUF1592 domain-containing protein [Opitutaceae bacterium]
MRKLTTGILTGVLALNAGLCLSAQAADVELDPFHFLQTHCIACHGEEKQKGDRRFDRLDLDFENLDTAWDWEEILDLMQLGEMPPKDEPQPQIGEKLAMIDWINGKLQNVHAARAEQESTQLRRLNAFEYRNTIRDLLHLNVSSFDPTDVFPPDEEHEGFTNLGKTLVLSDHLLEKYLGAAWQSLDKAIAFTEKPTEIADVFVADDITDRKFHFRNQIWFEVNVTGEYVDLGHGDRESRRYHAARFKGVPADGFYTIRIDANALGRINRYDPELLGLDQSEPLKAAIIVTDPSVGNPGSRTNASDRTVAVIPIKDHERETYEVRAWMDKGFVPILVFDNGPRPFKRRVGLVAAKYHLDVLPSNWRSGTSDTPAEIMDQYLSDVYEGPRLRIFNMSIEGPEIRQWPAPSHQVLFGKDPIDPDQIDPRAVIERFAPRAFRRPLLDSERDRYVNFYQQLIEQGYDAMTAIKSTLSGILTSPQFLYIDRPWNDGEAPPHADQFTLASRLSYFLWSTMPDEELLAVAARGELNSPHELRTQTLRMLRDKKARGLVEQFTDSWLHLNKLGSMPPDNQKFRPYYDRNMQPVMKEETRQFFQHILERNRPIDDFLNSDYLFVNRVLADHYGIENIEGDHFRQVPLPQNSQRGGLLSHASILTTTSNGVETSPVVRGIWILENILGTPPSPPPPDVEPLEPDIRGATTIREQLIKHREIETCAECHRKIDPLGFALESFDPIGKERHFYLDAKGKESSEVDTTGMLPTGQEFEDINELKDILLDRRHLFAKCLTEKMLTYALGRELTFADRSTVESILEKLENRGSGLQDLVELIVTSDAFRST